MVKDNNGILAYDNWCNVFGSPHLAVERDTPYIKSNFTVVGVSAYEFKERPRFKWTMDGKLAVASLPRTVADLEPYENKVCLLSCNFQRFCSFAAVGRVLDCLPIFLESRFNWR